MTLVLYGPTVTGKTDLAIKLAKKFNGSIISADSRQVYKGLDIGTGKVSFESTIHKKSEYWLVDDIRIYGFDLKSPGDQFSASDFISYALTKTDQIYKDSKLPIVVGGTGFYIKSLLYGVKTLGIEPDPKLRKRLESLSAKKLYGELLKLNRQKAISLNESDNKNSRRLIRAIEVEMHNKMKKIPNTHRPSSGVSYPNHLSNYLLIGLTAPNKFLYQRADAWVAKRLRSGLISEVKGLISIGVDPTWLISLGLEYRWITRYILQEVSQQESIERLKGDIHNFIRRQKTFFRQFEEIKAFNIEENGWQDKLQRHVEKYLNE